MSEAVVSTRVRLARNLKDYPFPHRLSDEKAREVVDKIDAALKDSGENVDRTRIYGAQTPQIFLSEDLKTAYNQGFDLSFTDDASVVRRYGVPLSYIAGERNNIKLTTPEDLSLAEAILQISG